MEDAEVVGPPTPGILRLPPELRLEIYRHLLNDETSKVYRAPDTHEYRITSRQLGRLPILQVCQQIKYEAIPIWYGQQYLHFQMSGGFSVGKFTRWVRRMDLYALLSMKGVQLQHADHQCRTWMGHVTYRETTIIGFSAGMALTCTTAHYLGGCCSHKMERDKERQNLRRRFKRTVHGKPDLLKEELIRLAKLLHDYDEKLRRNTWML